MKNWQPLEELRHAPIMQIENHEKINLNDFASVLSAKMQEEIESSFHDSKQKRISKSLKINKNSEAIQLPNKVYENCQRTSRVVMLSELQKLINKDKKLKLLFAKILQKYILNQVDSEYDCDYHDEKEYNKSLNYYRVRIGKKEFLKNFLFNAIFKNMFEIIFKEKSLEDSTRARKNKKSSVPLYQRREMVSVMIKEYEEMFYSHFKQTPEKENIDFGEKIVKEEHQKRQLKIVEDKELFHPLLNALIEYDSPQPMVQFFFFPFQNAFPLSMESSPIDSKYHD